MLPGPGQRPVGVLLAVRVSWMQEVVTRARSVPISLSVRAPVEAGERGSSLTTGGPMRGARSLPRRQTAFAIAVATWGVKVPSGPIIVMFTPLFSHSMLFGPIPSELGGETTSSTALVPPRMVTTEKTALVETVSPGAGDGLLS